MIYKIETSQELEDYMQEHEGGFLAYLRLACIDPVIRRFKRREIEKYMAAEIAKLESELKDDQKNITIKVVDKKEKIENQEIEEVPEEVGGEIVIVPDQEETTISETEVPTEEVLADEPLVEETVIDETVEENLEIIK